MSGSSIPYGQAQTLGHHQPGRLTRVQRLDQQALDLVHGQACLVQRLRHRRRRRGGGTVVDGDGVAMALICAPSAR
jgi:hypothetical protein